MPLLAVIAATSLAISSVFAELLPKPPRPTPDFTLWDFDYLEYVDFPSSSKVGWALAAFFTSFVPFLFR